MTARAGERRRTAGLADQLVEHELLSAISSQDANLQAALTLLPGTLRADHARRSGRSRRSRTRARTTLQALVPFAHAFGACAGRGAAAVPRHDAGDPEPAAPVRRRRAAAGARCCAPASAELAKATPPLVNTFSVLNTLFNTLAYKPGRPAELPVLGLVAEPHRRQPDEPAGRSGADRPWHLHGDLLASCSCSRSALAARRSGARPAARAAERARLEQDPNSPFCPTSACHEQASPEHRPDPDDGRVRGVVRRPVAVPVDLVRRLGSARPPGLPDECGIQRRG